MTLVDDKMKERESFIHYLSPLIHSVQGAYVWCEDFDLNPGYDRTGYVDLTTLCMKVICYKNFLRCIKSVLDPPDLIEGGLGYGSLNTL